MVHGVMVECWLCEAAIAPDTAQPRYRDERGGLHPWPDARVAGPCSARAIKSSFQPGKGNTLDELAL